MGALAAGVIGGAAAVGAGQQQQHMGKPLGAGGIPRLPGGPGWVPSNAKSKICKAWSMGTCSYGANCTFAHGEHELVPLPSMR